MNCKDDDRTLVEWRLRDAAWVAKARERLQSLSWFMKCLKEPLARLTNRQEKTRGFFFEGRFRSVAILDEESLQATCAYIDLNPVAAGIAEVPEASPHTSIKERVDHVKAQGRTEDLKAIAGQFGHRAEDSLRRSTERTSEVVNLRAKRGITPATHRSEEIGSFPEALGTDSTAVKTSRLLGSPPATRTLPVLALSLGPRPGPSSAATGDFKKLLPAGDAEIPHRVESIPFESDADLFDRHVRLGVELNELATARFGSGQHRVSSHEPNAAENAVELHEGVESLQRMADGLDGQARSLRNEFAVQRLADAELCFPLGVDHLRALRDPVGDDGSRGAHQGPTSRRDCHDDGRIHGFWNRRRGTRYSCQTYLARLPGRLRCQIVERLRCNLGQSCSSHSVGEFRHAPRRLWKPTRLAGGGASVRRHNPVPVNGFPVARRADPGPVPPAWRPGGIPDPGHPGYH